MPQNKTAKLRVFSNEVREFRQGAPVTYENARKRLAIAF
jgi:hypothetical protein